MRFSHGLMCPVHWVAQTVAVLVLDFQSGWTLRPDTYGKDPCPPTLDFTAVPGDCLPSPSAGSLRTRPPCLSWRALEATEAFWRSFGPGIITYHGLCRTPGNRSLTLQQRPGPHQQNVVVPTTSLPE